MDSDSFSNFVLLNALRIYKRRQESRRIRRWAVHPINRDRRPNGYFIKVFLKAKEEDDKLFVLTRMRRPIYDMLMNLLSNFLKNPKQQISTEERLAITIM